MIRVVMTRETDISVSLEERVEIANATDVHCFISVHCNGHENENARGFESYIYTSVPARTKSFQDILHRHVSAVWAQYDKPDRGQKSAAFFVLRYTKMHAGLTENGFITNTDDADLLKRPDFREALAAAHAAAIEEFLVLIGGSSVCLDSGHGGAQPGAVANGLKEKDVALDICIRIKRLLEIPNCTKIQDLRKRVSQLEYQLKNYERAVSERNEYRNRLQQIGKLTTLRQE